MAKDHGGPVPSSNALDTTGACVQPIDNTVGRNHLRPLGEEPPTGLRAPSDRGKRSGGSLPVRLLPGLPKLVWGGGGGRVFHKFCPCPLGLPPAPRLPSPRRRRSSGRCRDRAPPLAPRPSRPAPPRSAPPRRVSRAAGRPGPTTIGGARRATANGGGGRRMSPCRARGGGAPLGRGAGAGFGHSRRGGGGDGAGSGRGGLSPPLRGAAGDALLSPALTPREPAFPRRRCDGPFPRRSGIRRRGSSALRGG